MQRTPSLMPASLRTHPHSIKVLISALTSKGHPTGLKIRGCSPGSKRVPFRQRTQDQNLVYEWQLVLVVRFLAAFPFSVVVE